MISIATPSHAKYSTVPRPTATQARMWGVAAMIGYR